MSLSHAQKPHWNWKGGITEKIHSLRSKLNYRLWRESVKARDGYKCSVCGNINKSNHAHHVKSFKEFPKLRYDISNGITLCNSCHGKESILSNKQLNEFKYTG